MSKLILSKQEKESLERFHKTSRDGRERDRIKAVLLKAEGWSTSMIAQALRKDESSIVRHIREYQSSDKLSSKYPGRQSRLSAEQTQELEAHLREHLYQYNHQIVSYIDERWGIQFTVSGLHKWLGRHGFVYKQPKGMPYKAEAEKQAVFVEAYRILKVGCGADEPILFGDAVHPTQATKISHGWIKKGCDKGVKTTASRTRLNILGSIRLGHLKDAITASYETINAEAIVAYLPKLRAQYPDAKTIHWIVDGAGYHKAHIVQEKAEKLGINIHILPPYSPNLNPIERLWKVMNEHVRNNQFFHSAKEFRQRIEHFFEQTLPDIADSLDSRINDNFQILDQAISS